MRRPLRGQPVLSPGPAGSLFTRKTPREPWENCSFFRLRRSGIDVTRIPASGSEMLEGLAQAKEGDLVVFFAFSKLSAESRIILDYQRQAGYQTLCFTARSYLPKEDSADISLYVYRGEAGEYHSMAAPAAMIDALVLAVSEKLESQTAENLNRIHQLKERYRKR